jgi:pyruvyltransferase
MNRVVASWCLSLNFGDKLTYYLIEKITGKKPVYVDMSLKVQKVIGPGSILNWCDETCSAWTCGIANANDNINPLTKIYSVRGPITRERAIKCGAVCPDNYGDAGLLLNKFYTPKLNTYIFGPDVGVIPHWRDQYDTIDFVEKKGFKLINIFDPIETVADEICSCRKILSSALHGLITADAYGIPANRLIVTDKIGGDGTKFYDHDMAVLGGNRKCFNIKDLVSVKPEEIYRMIEMPKKPVFDIDKILKARPF